MKTRVSKIANSVLWVLFAFFAIVVGLYPGFYFILDRKFSLLAFKDDVLLKDVFWNVSFYTHIITGGLALLIGWLQFSSKLRIKQRSLHRTIGKSYTVLALFSSVAGLHLAFFAFGGTIARLGFGCLGIMWLFTTLASFLAIRKGKIAQHRQMAFLSYASCFSAVTLRLWLQLFIKNGMDFFLAYQIVAWLCWLPNVLVSVIIAKQNQLATKDMSTVKN